jgi:hypothetical protein
MLTDLINRLAEAIFRQEGGSVGTTNPGNLRDCPWFPQIRVEGPNPYRAYIHDSGKVDYMVCPEGRFWLPRTRAEGVAGTVHLIALRVAEGETLRELISDWVLPSDHEKTETYIKNVQTWASIPNSEKPLWSYLIQTPLP